jgi:hypothetical protein
MAIMAHQGMHQGMASGQGSIGASGQHRGVLPTNQKFVAYLKTMLYNG